jgi:outer membrane lipoprotein-sorting protein
MSFLRTISTPRLAALCASATALAAGGTAIALAGDSGPTPPPKPLAAAVHDAATAPETQGITANVKFTNHLVDSSGVRGGNPLLRGATGRLWLSPDRGVRLELQSDNGDAQVVANQDSFWVYDGTANTVYRGQVPAHKSDRGSQKPDKAHKVPSVARIQRGITRSRRHLDVSGATPGNIAGQPAYTVRVGPGRPGGLLGAVELAWDAAHGLPLRVAVYARGNSDPVLELVATDISYGPVADSTFTIAPPADAKTVDISPPRGGHGKSDGRKGHGKGVHGKAAVARRLPFQLSAPDTLGGLKRQSVTLLKPKGGSAALITYGTGPGTIAVVERAAKPEKPAAAPSGDHHGGGLELPTASINGATANVLETPLGSVVSFERGGVKYVVLGSVTAAVAEAAARGL